VKPNYLKGLSHVLNRLPKPVLLPELPTAVRIAALQCMHALTRLPTPVLLPYKPQVIRALAKPLDDKKRLVRKEAVSARGEWFLLGSPGS
ncbi:MMS19 isoform 19, partial [Pan troglodytes]